VAYSYTPSADVRVDINLCNDGTDYDTKLYVYEGGCPGTLIACNDDACSSPQFSSYVSRLPNVNLLGGHTYYIIVDGYGSACGNYHMTITELGPCAECPEGSTPENEPCNTDTNDGCNSSPFVFGSISFGETICGTSFFNGYTRDTDWYRINGLTGPNIFPITAEAEFDLQLLFITDTANDCVGYTYLFATAPACLPATIVTPGLPLDTYYIWVGPQFTSTFDCTAGDTQYWVHLGYQWSPSGACCKSGFCYDAYTESACLAIGGLFQGGNTQCADIICPPPPPGDACVNPFIVDALPYEKDTGSCKFSQDYVESCVYNPGAPDVVYAWTATSDTVINVSLCGSSYDTTLIIYAGECSPGSALACNDDFCGLQSEIDNISVSMGTTYYIVVSGYYNYCGDYHLNIQERGPCAECPEGSILEPEPCYTDTNGGCNSDPPIFGSISCGETVCGTSFFNGYTRDTDWFMVTGLTGANDMTVTAEAKFDLQLLFITDTGNDCVGYTYLIATAPACATATIATGGLPLNTYYIWVGPQFTATFDCTEGNPQYWVHLDCTPVPTGACCRIGLCYDGYTEDACWAFGGQYQGDNVVCHEGLCPPPWPPCVDRYIPGVPYNDADDTCSYVLDCPASCGNNNAPDVIYKWTPTEDGVATASLCGSSYDTVIHVQTTCCGDDIVCNDDYCGLQSQVEWNANAGWSYDIMVSGFSTTCGAYTLAVTEAPPPVGACCVGTNCIGDMTSGACAGQGGVWYQGQTCDNFTCPVPPPNDLCENAQPIIGPYPQTVYGTCIGATIDCPGVLDWTAVWYVLDLPYAVNNVQATYCTDPVGLGPVGIVYYNMCDDCPNYVIVSTYAWNTCSVGGDFGIDMYWNGAAGPTQIYIPVWVVDASGNPLNFTATFNVTSGAPGPQAPPMQGTPAITPDTARKFVAPRNVTGASKAQAN
jgi:hypothetical protein